MSPLDGDVLFSSMIKNEEFRTRFINSFTEMANNNFEYTDVHNKLTDISSKCKDADIKSQERFRGDFVISGYDPNEDFSPPYSAEDYDADIAVIDNFFKERKDYIITHMENDLTIYD